MPEMLFDKNGCTVNYPPADMPELHMAYGNSAGSSADNHSLRVPCARGQ